MTDLPCWDPASPAVPAVGPGEAQTDSEVSRQGEDQSSEPDWAGPAHPAPAPPPAAVTEPACYCALGACGEGGAGGGKAGVGATLVGAMRLAGGRQVRRGRGAGQPAVLRTDGAAALSRLANPRPAPALPPVLLRPAQRADGGAAGADGGRGAVVGEGAGLAGRGELAGRGAAGSLGGAAGGPGQEGAGGPAQRVVSPHTAQSLALRSRRPAVTLFPTLHHTAILSNSD